MSATEWAGDEQVATGHSDIAVGRRQGSTWLWETHPDDMGAAVARLDKAVSGVIAAHDGVRPVGRVRVIALSSRSPARRMPWPPRWTYSEGAARTDPVAWRAREVALHDESNMPVRYQTPGPRACVTWRMGGQTVALGRDRSLVIDRLPDKAWLVDLGTHALQDLSRRSG